LRQTTGVVLENSVLTELHRTLVERGDYEGAEAMVDRFIDSERTFKKVHKLNHDQLFIIFALLVNVPI